jgi:CopG family nickel-responsive transcriptional regulator
MVVGFRQQADAILQINCTQALGHHYLSLATLHVHLDDQNCMELTALQGPTKDVQHFADHVIAERGVKYGRVFTIPAPKQTAVDGGKSHSHKA